jgi:hypothetical protein
VTFGPINTCNSHNCTLIFPFGAFFAFELCSQLSGRTFGCFLWNAEFVCNSNSYNLQIVISWDVTLWSLVDGCNKVSEDRAHSTFKGAPFSLISTLKKETASLSEELHSFTNPYAVTAQNITIWTLTAGKTEIHFVILILRKLHVP